MAEDLQLVYENRFGGTEERRAQVWTVLSRHFLQAWVPESSAVLDLGAGYCEFINSIRARKKYALDLNPVTRSRAASDVEAVVHDVATPWPLGSGCIDLVFTSNFLEHLHSKDQLQFCLREAYRVLRKDGKMLLLGPNIRYCPDTYWDFLDHHLPLSDRSVVEALEIAGFKVRKVIPRFLPYTMRRKLPSDPWLVRLYLAVPMLWRIAGKQFFIAAEKP